MKVGTDFIAWVTLDAKRCYWACHWATWFPAVRGRVNAPVAFLRARIEGACRGRGEDREAPKEWFEKQAAVERGGVLGVTACRRIATAGPAVSPECADVWTSYLGAMNEAQSGFLAGARKVELEKGVLVVTLPSTLVAHLRRQELVLQEKAKLAGVECPVEFRALR